MGRKKLEMKKIENPTNRHATYSKRRNGLVKKARELAVLCDIDIAVIAFSPSGTLTEFCRDDSSIVKVITRYANYTRQQGRPKGKFEKVPENVEYLNQVAQKLTYEQGLEAPRVGYADLQLEVQDLRSQLKKALVERSVSEQNVRLLSDTNNFINRLNSSQCWKLRSWLAQALVKVGERMGQLERPEVGPGVRQNTVQQTSFEMISGLPARDGSNTGSTAHSTQAMHLHDYSGVHNLDTPPPYRPMPR